MKLYITGKGYLDLFDDELIEISDSVQNISDLTKVFTSYTQSFTIPASDTNNKIFKHWYNDFIVNGFDAQKSVAGFIELNNEIFKTGSFLLEKGTLKNGAIENYTISFVGDVFDIKSLLGEKTLQDIDYSVFDFTYNATNVINRIQDLNATSLGLCFPLVSSKNAWEYGSATSTDITTNTGSIKWNELYPSVSLSWIISAIINQFNLPIDTNYQDIIYNNSSILAHILYKNKDLRSDGTIDINTDIKAVDFGAGTGTNIDYANDLIKFQLIDASNYLAKLGITPLAGEVYTFIVAENYIKVTCTGIVGIGYLNIKRNGQIVRTITINGTGVFLPYTPILDLESYSFEVYTQAPTTVGLTFEARQVVNYYKRDFSLNLTYNSDDITESFTTSVNTTSFIPLSQLAPNIKLIDIVKAVTTMYNGVFYKYKNQDDLLRYETLEKWYVQGDVLDITEFIDASNIEVSRVKLPKKIEFKKDECKSSPNTTFYDALKQKHGDLVGQYDYDGNDVTFSVPIETPIPIKIGSISYMLLKDKDAKEYTPKCLMLTFGSRVTGLSVKVYDGSTYVNVTGLFPTTTSIDSNGHSINFGAEYENLDGQIKLNGFYKRYYERYFNNLFNPQMRAFSVKGNLPYSIMTKLTLNDRLLIGDRSFIINDYKLELTKGNITLNLLRDFRAPIEEVVINIPNTATTVTFTPSVLVGWSSETSELWKGNEAMGVNYVQYDTATSKVTNVPLNPITMQRQGHYFIYFTSEGIIQDRVIKVRIIQDSAPLVPSNALATTYGEPFVTTYGEFIITTY